MFNLGQTIVFKGFNYEAHILAITDSGYVLVLNSGYTYEMPFDQAHRAADYYPQEILSYPQDFRLSHRVIHKDHRAYMRVCVCARMCVRTHTHMCACACARVRTCMYIYMRY